MEKSSQAQIIKTVSRAYPKKLSDLGFMTSTKPTYTKSESLTPTYNILERPPTSTTKLKFVDALKNFENSIHPTLKELIKNQRLDFNIGSTKQNNIRIGKIGSNPDGTPIIGLKYTRKL
jgi:hypothetical protein